MMIKKLQTELDKKNIPVKVLYVEKTKCGFFEVIYTPDLTYEGRDYTDLKYIISPERDVLVKDFDDIVNAIKLNEYLREKGGEQDG